MSGKNFCELCGEAGLSSRLVPYQMNSEEAIFICENSECVFPLGTLHVGNFVVSRKATEISNIKRKRKKIPSKNNPENSSLKSTSISTPEHFINWENVDALCWLHCTLSLIVHNKTLRNLVSTIQTPNSLLKSILDCYFKAQQLALSDLTTAKKILEDIRQNVWMYLAPKMKCSLGVNDSPIFALPLLLNDNGVTLEKCLQEYTWEFSCDLCGFEEKTRQKKHLVTYPNTPEDFDFEKASFLRPCPKCKSSGQKSTIVHEAMPDLVLMHFVEGLMTEDYLDSNFVLNKSRYQLTQFLQYSRNPDHFICWCKENDGTRWLELDDLKTSVCSWSSSTPKVPPSEVHVVVFEKITSESCENKINSKEYKSEKVIDDINRVLVSPTEILRNTEISFSKAEVCFSKVNDEESISCHMDALEVIEDVEEKEITSKEKNLESKIIASEEIVSNESLSSASVSGKHDGDLPGRSPLKDCSNIPDNWSSHGKTVATSIMALPSQTSLRPEKTSLINRNSPSVISPSLTSSNLENSLIKATVVTPNLALPTQTSSQGVKTPLTHRNTPPVLSPSLTSSNLENSLIKATVTTPNMALPTQTSSQPENTSLMNRKTPPVVSSSLTSTKLENSLIKVTLKKYSLSKKFQPSLNNKRRTLSSQFQPYVPKKQRIEPQIVNNKPTLLDFDSHSDSGYSSPSSVSSCGSGSSTTSMETEQKMSVTDDIEKMEIDDSNHENIAEELEKLLPDCLLEDRRKRSTSAVDDEEQIIHSETMKLEGISQEQDDFIRNLLFDD
ncbi:SUMO-specific isopeptidase USPL1-like [Actinia tenebrosa]|uniref:SUMO-specific isopeptidase USPL1-like n=1 Tax=Actinia tenebrosa TaxID=6105 RepID=A0A6P8HLE4_ACTTE|nr:SUMO-specific isopeptidase USPL1-like [Actinia tenebrosa]